MIWRVFEELLKFNESVAEYIVKVNKKIGIVELLRKGKDDITHLCHINRTILKS